MRLIDADALKANRRGYSVKIDNLTGAWPCVLLAEIADAPTIDPEELRLKGEWTENRHRSYDDLRDEYVIWFTYTCSNPKCNFESMGNHPYCPNCGTNMRGDDDAR